MFPTLVIILAVIVLAVVIVLILAAMKPDTLRVQRSTSIKAAPELIFALINDFHAWPQWSPYEKYDAAMKRTYSGPPAGTGAVYEWDGNNKVGQGRMEITDIAQPSRVTIKLDFVRPFEGHNVAEFLMQPAGDQTNVTWTMTGPCAFMHKVVGLFMNMDHLIGKDFDAGLANLKSATEK